MPSKTLRQKQDIPWLTPEIKRLIRKRDRLYKKLKSRRVEERPNIIKKHRSAKYLVQQKLRQSYWNYIENIIIEDSKLAESKPSKKLWSFIKNQKSENVGVSPLKVNGKTKTNHIDQAEALNNQFHSAFTTPKPLKLSHIYELNKLKSQDLKFQMHDIIITPEGTSKLLKNLNPTKAIGPDKISPHFLKEVHEEISPMISDLFQSSDNTGTVPTDWREAIVTPVFKKGAKSKPENYRPISLTCILSKVLELIIVSSIMNHLDIHNLLYPLQHGFRSKLSCETQLLTFTKECFDSMASGKQTDVAVMDFSKVFDKVDHQRLNLKLKRMGINNKTSNWIGAWLSHRFQRVVVDGHTSNSCPVLSGIPQGSVLGPCLILIYINDMPDTLKSNVRLFADDTIVYLTISVLTDCHTLHSDLHKLEKWEEEWLMSFNPNTCEIIHISRKQKPIIFQYTLHNQVLKSTNKAKYLGVTIY